MKLPVPDSDIQLLTIPINYSSVLQKKFKKINSVQIFISKTCGKAHPVSELRNF